MTLSRDQLLRLARTGAADRVKQLQAELEAIYRTFPELRSGKAAAARTAREGTAPARGARKAWSPAKRKAAAERMKKYWADRKAAGGPAAKPKTPKKA